MFRYMIMLALAVPWSLIVYLLLSTSLANLILFLLFSCGVGAAIYSLYLSILESRFRSPIVNEQFSQVVEQAHERVGSRGLVHVWQRKSPEPYIASTFNLLFNAVIVSETMVDLILKMPASGEALLGFHLLHRPSRRNILDFIAAVVIFSASSSFLAWYLRESLFLFGLFPPSIVSTSGVLFFGLVILILLKDVFWTHDSAFERAAAIYNIHPQVARDEVLSSARLDEEAAKSVVWVVMEWERGKRSGRRLIISGLVFGIMYLVLFSSLIVGGFYSVTYSIVLSALVPAGSLLVTLGIYLFLRRWDKKCMGDIYYGTTDAHEPIWVD